MIHAVSERTWIMGGRLATRTSRGDRTLSLPIPEETYQKIIDDPHASRRSIDDCFRRMPELFPGNFQGYQLMGHALSAKLGVKIWRVLASFDPVHRDDGAEVRRSF